MIIDAASVYYYNPLFFLFTSSEDDLNERIRFIKE